MEMKPTIKTKLLRVLVFACSLQLIAYSSANAQSTEIQYLSGTGSDKTVNWQFFCTAGRNSGKWTTIAVPGNWEVQGFGKYNYGHRNGCPFTRIATGCKEQGLYK